MMDEVNNLPSLPRDDLPEESPLRDDSSILGGDPEIDTRSPLEKEINTMTQDDLDHLRKSCSFPPEVQAKIPEDDETILSTRPSKVDFIRPLFMLAYDS